MRCTSDIVVALLSISNKFICRDSHTQINSEAKVIEETLGNEAMALFLQGAGGDIIDIYFKDFNQPRNIETIGIRLGLSVLKALKNIETKNADLNVVREIIKLPRKSDFDERIRELQSEQSELLESLRGCCLNFKSFLPIYLKFKIYILDFTL